MSTIAQDAIALKTKVEAHFSASPSAEANSANALLTQLVHVLQYIVEEPVKEEAPELKEEPVKEEAPELKEEPVKEEAPELKEEPVKEG
jgi:hypothetical protein